MSAPAPAGLVVVDKPGGLTSHDVVSRVRRLAGTRKVGHAGTLDPMATGVLVLGLGRATRLLGHLVQTEKVYDATVRLGQGTSTDDAEGEVTWGAPAAELDEGRIAEALAAFLGEIDQVPSTVSAVKVDGRRAYERVRAGEDVRLEPRRVVVHALDLHEVSPSPAGAAATTDVRITVRCSSGTYVRAIARDLGEALGVGGHLVALRRTAVGGFDLGVAATLEELEQDFSVLPLDEAARRSFPVQRLDEGQARAVGFGRPLPDLTLAAGDGPVAMFGPDDRFLALYHQRGREARPVAVFT